MTSWFGVPHKITPKRCVKCGGDCTKNWWETFYAGPWCFNCWLKLPEANIGFLWTGHFQER